MLDMFQQDFDQEAAPRANEGRDLPATFGESFQDAWQSGQDAVSSLKQKNARNQAIGEYAEAVKGAGGDVDGEYQKEAATSGNLLWASPPDPLTVINNVVGRMKAQADAAGVDMPFTPVSEGDINDRAVTLSQQAMATQQRNLQRPHTWASFAGNILGGAASATVDPINIPALAIPFEGLGVLATAGLMGAANAAAQTASEISNSAYNERVQPGYAAGGQGLENVVGAGVGGAVLGGSVRVLGNVLTRAMTGAWPTAARDAANGVMSEANVLNSNVLPGAEGEAAHNDALGQSIAQILRGDPVDPDIAAASQAVMAKAQRDQAFTLPKFDAAEVSRLSEEAELHERSGALTDQLAGLPAGDQGAADTLARLRTVESQLGEATTPEARRALSNRRDELLTDTTPETLQDAAAPIEQRRAATSEQAAIDARLQEIQNERGQAQLDQAASGEPAQEPLSQRVRPYQEPTLFDVHTGRIDALLDMREGAIAAGEGSPEMPYRTNGIARGVRALAQIGGSDMSPDEAQALARRIVASGTSDEARFILNQVTDRPRTLMSTLPSPEDFAEAMKAGAADAPRPGFLTADQIREQLAAPETASAARADVERAIDEAAQSGKELQTPTGLKFTGGYDKAGLPIMDPSFGSVADQLAEVDKMNELAAQILACATPGAMQMAAE